MTQDESSTVEPNQILSSKSYDADTPTVLVGGQRQPLRIAGVGGEEIKTGGDAEYFRNGLYGIFGGEKVEAHIQGQGVFGRNVGDLDVDGISWRHLNYEVGVSNRWTNYGVDSAGSLEDERYKWYGGESQQANLEAYELLEQSPNPSDIISDEEYARLDALRRSLRTHIADVNEGVQDTSQARAVAQELFADPDKLALAQKRRWYEAASQSTVGQEMLAQWNNPASRVEIERNARVPAVDVSEKVDTSYTAMAKNAFMQQWSDVGQINFEDGMTGLPELLTPSEQVIDDYITDNELAPNEAVQFVKEVEEFGFNAAKDTHENAELHREVLAIEKKNEDDLVKTIFHGAMPYLLDPTTYVGGSLGFKAGTKITTKLAQRNELAKPFWSVLSKKDKAYVTLTSPITTRIGQAGTVGVFSGLGESVAYTTNNYRDRTPKELMEVWAMDAGMGGAFGGVFGLLADGVRGYGKAAKNRAAGEGMDDITYTPDVDPAPDVETPMKDFLVWSQKRVDELTDEVNAEIKTGNVEPPTTTLDIEGPVVKPEPTPEPILDSHAKGETPEGAELPEPVDPEVELRNWQTESINVMLDHQQNVVRPALQKVDEDHNLLAKTHRLVVNSLGLQEMASKLRNSADAKTSFIGTNILESGIGFSGKSSRKASAALVKDSIYTRHVGNINKSYVDNIEAWAMSQGGSKYKAFKSAWEGGKVNDVARAFHKEVIRHQENIRLGRPSKADENVLKYVDSINTMYDDLYAGQANAKVKGFEEPKESGFIPKTWKRMRIQEISKKYGDQSILDLYKQSLKSMSDLGKLGEDIDIDKAASELLKWTKGIDSAGKRRSKVEYPLDYTVEHNGISMMDLIETDLPTVMDGYVQKSAANIGVSEATGKVIRSEEDFIKYLTPGNDEDKLFAQDVRDILYGRPTRGGLAPELRNMMDMVTLQQMGGIGAAQLAETGTMAQRLIVNYMSEPSVAKKIWAMAGEDINDKGVMAQVRSIAAVNDNMEYINRYSVNNIDQAQIDKLSDIRAASLDAADKLTTGAYKAQFGRLLGKFSGVNAIQKAQSRLLQASFATDIAREFKLGKGTSTNPRLADLGLTHTSATAKAIKKHVEFDEEGFPTNFNFDKWTKNAKDQFVHAMNREEAQLMPRVMAGELPTFMNKPLATVLMQFRKTPLAFMSKGTQRNLQFADREAVFGTVLNAMTAGTSRYAKVALAGGAYTALGDSDFKHPTLEAMQPWNYISNFGIMGDAYSLYGNWVKAAKEHDGIESLWEGAKQVSVISGVDAAFGALQGDATDIKKATPLNTLPLVNEVTNAVIRSIEQN